MRVLYDGVVFQNSYQRGIQRTFRDVIDALPPEFEAIVALSDKPKCPLPKRAQVVRVGSRFARALPRSLRRPVQRFAAPRGIRRLAKACDVFHSTYYTLPPCEIPTVLHVYDLIPECFPECFDPEWSNPEIERRRAAIEHADAIIAISQATADEIARLYPTAAGKTVAIHLGREHLTTGISNTPSPSCPPVADYALYVGDRSGYKNFAVVLEALELPSWPAELGLCVVGADWRPEELARVERVSRTRCIDHLGRVSDADLGSIYAGARCLISSSLAEGFGFPAIEAHTMGTPLVCSDIAASREVAGDAALFFDPRNAPDLVARVREALEPDIRARLIAQGRANLARFTWSRCAEQVAEVYRRIARS